MKPLRFCPYCGERIPQLMEAGDSGASPKSVAQPTPAVPSSLLMAEQELDKAIAECGEATVKLEEQLGSPLLNGHAFFQKQQRQQIEVEKEQAAQKQRETIGGMEILE